MTTKTYSYTVRAWLMFAVQAAVLVTLCGMVAAGVVVLFVKQGFPPLKFVAGGGFLIALFFWAVGYRLSRPFRLTVLPDRLILHRFPIDQSIHASSLTHILVSGGQGEEQRITIEHAGGSFFINCVEFDGAGALPEDLHRINSGVQIIRWTAKECRACAKDESCHPVAPVVRGFKAPRHISFAVHAISYVSFFTMLWLATVTMYKVSFMQVRELLDRWWVYVLIAPGFLGVSFMATPIRVDITSASVVVFRSIAGTIAVSAGDIESITIGATGSMTVNLRTGGIVRLWDVFEGLVRELRSLNPLIVIR